MAEEKKPPGEGENKPPGEGEGKAGEEGGWKSSPKAGGGIKLEREGAKKEWGAGNRTPEEKKGAEGEAKEGEKEGEKGEVKKEIKFGPLFKWKREGAVKSTKAEGSEEKTFASALEGKISAEILSGSIDLDKKAGKLTVVDAKAEGSVAHGQVDLVDKIKHFLFGDKPKPAPPAAPPSPAPMAARMGDMTAHGFPLVGGPGSPNVFIGGMPAWRANLDVHICPAYHGAGPTTLGAPTVFINGAPAARAGDFVVEPTGGPDVILLGCTNVFIGPKASPPNVAPPAAPAKPDEPWVLFESVAEGDFLKGEADAKIVAEGDLAKRKGKLEAQAGIMGAVLKGELPLKIRLRIPFTSVYVGLGVTVEGTLLSAGAEAGAGVKVNDGKKFFEATAGAKAGVGIGGVGVKFGLDVSKK